MKKLQASESHFRADLKYQDSCDAYAHARTYTCSQGAKNSLRMDALMDGWEAAQPSFRWKTCAPPPPPYHTSVRPLTRVNTAHPRESGRSQSVQPDNGSNAGLSVPSHLNRHIHANIAGRVWPCSLGIHPKSLIWSWSLCFCDLVDLKLKKMQGFGTHPAS